MVFKFIRIIAVEALIVPLLYLKKSIIFECFFLLDTSLSDKYPQLSEAKSILEVLLNKSVESDDFLSFAPLLIRGVAGKRRTMANKNILSFVVKGPELLLGSFL